MVIKERFNSSFSFYASNYAEVKVLKNVIKIFHLELEFTETRRKNLHEHGAY